MWRNDHRPEGPIESRQRTRPYSDPPPEWKESRADRFIYALIATPLLAARNILIKILLGGAVVTLPSAEMSPPPSSVAVFAQQLVESSYSRWLWQDEERKQAARQLSVWLDGDIDDDLWRLRARLSAVIFDGLKRDDAGDEEAWTAWHLAAIAYLEEILAEERFADCGGVLAGQFFLPLFMIKDGKVYWDQWSVEVFKILQRLHESARLLVVDELPARVLQALQQSPHLARWSAADFALLEHYQPPSALQWEQRCRQGLQLYQALNDLGSEAVAAYWVSLR